MVLTGSSLCLYGVKLCIYATISRDEVNIIYKEVGSYGYSLSNSLGKYRDWQLLRLASWPFPSCA